MSDYEFKIWLVFGLVVGVLIMSLVLWLIFYIDDKRNKWKYQANSLQHYKK